MKAGIEIWKLTAEGCGPDARLVLPGIIDQAADEKYKPLVGSITACRKAFAVLSREDKGPVLGQCSSNDEDTYELTGAQLGRILRALRLVTKRSR